MKLSRIMEVLAIIGLLMVLASYKYVERDADEPLPPDGEPDPLREESYKWVSAMGEAVVAGDVEAGYEEEQHLYLTYDDVSLLARYLEAVRIRPAAPKKAPQPEMAAGSLRAGAQIKMGWSCRPSKAAVTAGTIRP